MNTFSLIIAVSLSFSLFPLAHSKEAHRHHEAHVHGAGELKIVFEQQEGKVEFKSAADSVLGFEHEAKSEKDRKTLADAYDRFQTKINEMILFAADLGCQIKTDKVEVVRDGGHADFVARYAVLCQKSPAGSELKIDFTSLKRMKDLDVTLLVDDLQLSAEIEGKPLSIQIKK